MDAEKLKKLAIDVYIAVDRNVNSDENTSTIEVDAIPILTRAIEEETKALRSQVAELREGT